MNNTYEFPRNKLPPSSQNSKTPTLKSSSAGVSAVPVEEPGPEKQSASPASRALDKRGAIVKIAP